MILVQLNTFDLQPSTLSFTFSLLPRIYQNLHTQTRIASHSQLRFSGLSCSQPSPFLPPDSLTLSIELIAIIVFGTSITNTNAEYAHQFVAKLRRYQLSHKCRHHTYLYAVPRQPSLRYFLQLFHKMADSSLSDLMWYSSLALYYTCMHHQKTLCYNPLDPAKL